MFRNNTIEFSNCVELVESSLITILVNKHIFVVALLQKHKVQAKSIVTMVTHTFKNWLC